jgi:hypothetical protein
MLKPAPLLRTRTENFFVITASSTPSCQNRWIECCSAMISDCSKIDVGHAFAPSRQARRTRNAFAVGRLFTPDLKEQSLKRISGDCTCVSLFLPPLLLSCHCPQASLSHNASAMQGRAGHAPRVRAAAFQRGPVVADPPVQAADFPQVPAVVFPQVLAAASRRVPVVDVQQVLVAGFQRDPVAA